MSGKGSSTQQGDKVLSADNMSGKGSNLKESNKGSKVKWGGMSDEDDDINMSGKGSETIELNDDDGITTDENDDKIEENTKSSNLEAKEGGKGSANWDAF
jgi:hypothetical protein